MRLECTFLGPTGLAQGALTRKEAVDITPLDLMVYVVGWEGRATHLATTVGVGAGHVVGLRFASRSTELDARKEKILRQFNKAIKKLEIVPLSATIDYLGNCRTIEGVVDEEYRKLGRPLNVGIDITCLPKMYIAFFVAFVLKRGVCATLEVFYGEGKYIQSDAGGKEGSSALTFSTGEWDTVDVPYIESSVLGDHNKNLIMSVGAEIRQARAFMNRFEPNRLAIFGVHNSDKRLDLDRVPDSKGMQKLFKSVRDGGGTATLFNLEDVGALMTATAEIVESCGSGKVTIFAVGCKPHTLAMTLVAIAYPNVELVCRKPGAYANYDAVPFGPIRRYRVRDRFEPYAYLK